MKIKIKDNASKLYWGRINARGARYCPTDTERAYGDMLEKINGATLDVDTKHLFCDQYNTCAIDGVSAVGMRIMQDSVEAVIDDIRDNIGECGYCGKQHPQQIEGFCNSCLGNQYLTEDRLHLLRILPISTPRRANRAPLTADESATLLPLYRDSQLFGAGERGKQKTALAYRHVREKLAKAIKDHTAEHDVMIWLLDHCIEIDNVIYYSHTDTVCFGWRNKMSPTEKGELQGRLLADSFPFKYEFHKDS